MKKVYENEKGRIRIYEEDDGTAGVVHAQMMTRREVWNAATYAEYHESLDEIARFMLAATIREAGGEPFGPTDARSIGRGVDALRVLRGDNPLMEQDTVIVVDYFGYYWPDQEPPV